jgi:hypothetical protein
MLIYAHQTSPRLQYICKFIFGEQLAVGYSLTIDSESFKEHDGPKINYSDLEMDADIFTLRNHPLLFENDIKEQHTECFEQNGSKAFFKTVGSDYPFDILAASFYLLSRYEEYLPHKKDQYGRYAHENSLAFKEGFLQTAQINRWLNDFGKALQSKFPELTITRPPFSFTPSYDIDIAWSYRNKGLWRNVGGFLKKPSLERLAVLTGFKKDPFDVYAYLKELHDNHNLHPIYFFLVATKNARFDKNISPYQHAMWQLMKNHSKNYQVGLHPSWNSNENPSLLLKEKKILETATNQTIEASRQHYIKLNLPESYEQLIAAGITHEYSMGYGSINGFRASVASPFYWYNLKTDEITKLRIHPFCFMDANSFYEQKQKAAESFTELNKYYEECKNNNGQMISIFHNSFLGTDPLYEGWREMYDKFISQLQQ